METIKVNMSPNPLDVQTIHASQNDGEARQWEFELHNNGELIDTSDVTEQMVFKAYEGGTEQLLPENGSTPTTSPFKGDIRYPQGLLTDQEFTYRQSPTEEDGNAKITDIKGNTLVWNQIQPNTISRTNNGITYTYDNGKLTVTGTATSTSYWLYGGLPKISMKANHKYLFVFGKGMEGASLTTFNWYLPNSGQIFYTDGIITINSDTDQYIQLQVMNGYTIDAVFYPQVFDLTQMFDTGNETTIEEFKSLFPLPYYDYNAGTLLSFNGTGLRSVSEDESREDTLTLPVATYFPTGMKSAGNVYDELTPRKAITRVGMVDLGSLTWGYSSTAKRFYCTGFANNVKNNNANTLANALCDVYSNGIWNQVQGDATKDKVFSISESNVLVRDSQYTTASAFKQAMIDQNVKLYYELANPTETSFTTASLVTENAEIPLSNDDGVLIGKCTEQLSENPGFIDAKIKLSDADGTCYSNKLQLHVERSPQ